jgi:serine O-acetyltransferase
VVKDVPPNSTVVGIPGKVVKKDGKPELAEERQTTLPDPLLHTLDDIRKEIAELDRRMAMIEHSLSKPVDKKAALILGGAGQSPS